MKSRIFLAAFILLALLAGPLLSAPPNKNVADDGFRQLPRAVLDVTDGQVGETADGSLTIASPEVRATENGPSSKGARLVFVYHGPTQEVSKLASGAVARQIGLKLRAKNTCNLLYVMWKLDSDRRVAVSVKRNPGMTTHQECGASGYVNIQPAFQLTKDKFPNAEDSKPHTLEARVLKSDPKRFDLIVKADGTIVWEGPIDAALLDDIDGPAGFRTDNGAFTFKFYSQEASGVQYGDWKEDKKKDRFVCELRYPLKSSANRLGSQFVFWYPNDSERKDYYYFASKPEVVWARCLCPNSSTYNGKELKWSTLDKKAWTDSPVGISPVPKDGQGGRATIDVIPALPSVAKR